MEDGQQLALLKQGVAAWNSWRLVNPLPLPASPTNRVFLPGANLVDADLRDANLSNANLNIARLRGANLSSANLSNSELVMADLTGADLSNADLTSAILSLTHLSSTNLSGANLSGARFYPSDVAGANLSRAKLDSVVFRGVDLRDVIFTDAKFGNTIFNNVNLRNTTGLDTCEHIGPSSIDYATFARSGSLPFAFLRGCGLPDDFINYLPSIMNDGIQFYSCFISYSTNDQDFAERLYSDLQNKGVRCWFAPHDMQGGKKLHEQIDEAIRIYERLLLILSPASMNSEWVKTEIAKARKRELQEKRRMLFPVRLVEFGTLQDWECFDSDAGKDSAREIREYYVPDFSNWKDHDAYQKEFDKLLRDLKSEEKLKAS